VSLKRFIKWSEEHSELFSAEAKKLVANALNERSEYIKKWQANIKKVNYAPFERLIPGHTLRYF
jgi:hypothetical protein